MLDESLENIHDIAGPGPELVPHDSRPASHHLQRRRTTGETASANLRHFLSLDGQIEVLDDGIRLKRVHRRAFSQSVQANVRMRLQAIESIQENPAVVGELLGYASRGGKDSHAVVRVKASCDQFFSRLLG